MKYWILEFQEDQLVPLATSVGQCLAVVNSYEAVITVNWDPPCWF